MFFGINSLRRLGDLGSSSVTLLHERIAFVCWIILTYETAAANSVVAQKRAFPAHFVIRQEHVQLSYRLQQTGNTALRTAFQVPLSTYPLSQNAGRVSWTWTHMPQEKLRKPSTTDNSVLSRSYKIGIDPSASIVFSSLLSTGCFASTLRFRVALDFTALSLRFLVAALAFLVAAAL